MKNFLGLKNLFRGTKKPGPAVWIERLCKFTKTIPHTLYILTNEKMKIFLDFGCMLW